MATMANAISWQLAAYAAANANTSSEVGLLPLLIGGVVFGLIPLWRIVIGWREDYMDLVDVIHMILLPFGFIYAAMAWTQVLDGHKMTIPEQWLIVVVMGVIPLLLLLERKKGGSSFVTALIAFPIPWGVYYAMELFL